MISYAQNFEDVILQRVFRDRSQGFYIDVGAYDPVVESVTKFFYDQGWSGINIEPNAWFYEKLVQERPRDMNLQLAVADTEESRTLYVFEQYGISTFEASNRDRFTEQGYQAEERTVDVTTLAAVCRQYVTGPIDFLKVDCEGWERLALKGADWERFRPIVLIVEATEPGTTIPSWGEWQPVVESAQYDFVYFDGLNRFYLRRESAHLRSHFEVPPNIFDGFKLYAAEQAEREREEAKQRLIQLEAESRHAGSQIVELQQRETMRSAELERLQKDLSDARACAGQLEKTLLQTRLWVGRLSQEIAAAKRG